MRFTFFLLSQFQSRSSSHPQLNNDDVQPAWAPHTPSHQQNGGGKENDFNHVNSLPDSVKNEGDIRSVLSPQKPVNLLPQVPINSSGYRKLSENEEHDCEIIG